MARGGADLTHRAAALFTVRGKMVITVADWMCEAGHLVEYDGAEDALFAFEAETVYARVFLDAMLETCVIQRTTISAAAELSSALCGIAGRTLTGKPVKHVKRSRMVVELSRTPSSYQTWLTRSRHVVKRSERPAH